MNNARRYAATIGTFDGVHLGHQRVLQTLHREARRRNLIPLAITFNAHPLSVIAPERTPKIIMSTDYKLSVLKSFKVATHTIDFTPATARMSAAEWMSKLHYHHAVDCIIIGYDNTFGHDGRSLSPDDYIRIGEALGIEVIVAPELEGISSSAIRRSIAEGRIGDANSMLGRPLTFDGIVEEGDHIGRTIGVPTANLRPSDSQARALPPLGVYASFALLSDGRRLPAVTNIGLRPSVSNIASTPSPRIETHILNYNGSSLYGTHLKVELIRFMRPEQKFNGLEALKAQLQDDIRQRSEMADVKNLQEVTT